MFLRNISAPNRPPIMLKKLLTNRKTKKKKTTPMPTPPPDYMPSSIALTSGGRSLALLNIRWMTLD